MSTAVRNEQPLFIFPVVSRIVPAFNRSTPVVLLPSSVHPGAGDPARMPKHPLFSAAK